MSTVTQPYRYAHPSFVEAGDRPKLVLATADARGEAHPHFFEGRLLAPRLTAELLTTLQIVVGSRFFTPANSVALAIALADPVVTAGGGQLRFEGFSSCGSAYARVDLLPEAYDGEVVGKGTTNVDFNAPMRAALAQVSDTQGLAISVGRDALTLHSGDHAVVERKVALPLRWVRGLLEVQSYMASMVPRLDASAVEVNRFMRTLPKASTSRTPLWIARGPAGLMSTTLPVDAGVRITEIARLRVFQPLLARAKSLRVYADPAGQASAWVLDFGTARFTLAVSAETWRGFSGEGQALRALLRHGDDGAGFAAVRAQLQWAPSLDADALAAQVGQPRDHVEDHLRVLGASGLVGFDLAEGRYFHRELPLDLSLAEDLHPRLGDARALLQAGAVTLTGRAPLSATVDSQGVLHQVREADGQLRCTCPWFARHQGDRGPCKHVLAVEAAQSLGTP